MGQAVPCLGMGRVAWTTLRKEVSGRQEHDGSEPARVKTSIAEEGVSTRSAYAAAALPRCWMWGGDPEPPRGRMQTDSAPAGAGGHL
jgi:hypothetical protein